MEFDLTRKLVVNTMSILYLYSLGIIDDFVGVVEVGIITGILVAIATGVLVVMTTKTKLLINIQHFKVIISVTRVRETTDSNIILMGVVISVQIEGAVCYKSLGPSASEIVY